MSEDLWRMFSYQIDERNKEIHSIEEKVKKFEKQIEILNLTKKLRYFEIDILNEQKDRYEEKYL